MTIPRYCPACSRSWPADSPDRWPGAVSATLDPGDPCPSCSAPVVSDAAAYRRYHAAHDRARALLELVGGSLADLDADPSAEDARELAELVEGLELVGTGWRVVAGRPDLGPIVLEDLDRSRYQSEPAVRRAVDRLEGRYAIPPREALALVLDALDVPTRQESTRRLELLTSARVRVGEPSTKGADAALAWAAERREAAGDLEHAAIYRKVRDQSTGDLAAAALEVAVRRGVEARTAELREPWPDLEAFVRSSRDPSKPDPSAALVDLLGVVGDDLRGRVAAAFDTMDAFAFAAVLGAICQPRAVDRVEVDQDQVRRTVERFRRQDVERFASSAASASTAAERAAVRAAAAPRSEIAREGEEVVDVKAHGSRVTVGTSSGWRFAFDVVPVGAVNVRTRSSTLGGVVMHGPSDYMTGPDPVPPHPREDRADELGDAGDLEDPEDRADRLVDELAGRYRKAGEDMAGYDFPADDQAFDAARELGSSGGRSRD